MLLKTSNSLQRLKTVGDMIKEIKAEESDKVYWSGVTTNNAQNATYMFYKITLLVSIRGKNRTLTVMTVIMMMTIIMIIIVI